MRTTKWSAPVLAGMFWFFAAGAAAQQAEPAQKLTLKQAVALAVQNSSELTLARLQYTAAQMSAGVVRAQFRPNLYTGSGAAYTNGFPQTPGGAAPSVFNLSYEQAVFNLPLRGELRAAENHAEAQRIAADSVRDAVIVRTASAYLELAKVRRSLELLRNEREGAQKIVDVTRQRLAAGLELPIELTRAQLSAARVEQRIAQLEGREEELDAQLRNVLRWPPDKPLDVSPEEVPAGAGGPVDELVRTAITNNLGLKQAETERAGLRERLKGEHGGYWPTVSLIGEYSVLSKINNYDQFFRRFQRNNLNVGVEVRIPIFSAQTSAAVAEARSNLSVADVDLQNKRAQLEVNVRQQARKTRELELARQVAQLELQIAQENLRVLQEQFQQGRSSLSDVEKARLDESEKWLTFLDADYARQQVQLQLLATTGQVAQVFQ